MNETRSKKIYRWLDDRLGLSTLFEFASHKTVPVHRYSVFYYLGGMTLFFFLVQVCTGILLMLYYRPSGEEAFESIEFIMTTVPFGWMIRSIHSWSANLMVFFAFCHMTTVYFVKAYRPPRELTWVSGAVVFFLILGFGFSGYLLPWNQLAFSATKVGTDIAGVVPVVGPWMLRFLRGGDRVAGGTLSRFYGWHVAILPAITSALLGLHLLLVQVKGMSVPPALEDEKKQGRPMKFFPNFAMRDMWAWILALGVLAALAALFPWELGDKADPFAPAYAHIRPEWYYVFMFQTLKLVPGGEILHVEYEAIPIMLFSLGGLLLLLVPFIDRGVVRRGKSPLFDVAGVLALIFIVAMTCWGYEWSLVPLWIVLGAAALLAIMAFVTRPSRESEEGGSGGSARTALITAGMVVLLGVAAANAFAAPPAKTSCIACHSSDMFDAAAKAKVKTYADDVHAKVGLSCQDCHGGNPDPKLAEDMVSAMDASYKPNPYVGKPDRVKMPEFCGRCHSSAAYMKKFNPSARVDVVNEYRSSMHGQQLAKGDPNVAMCIDCHGVHGILRKDNPAAPVYPTHVAETCSRCHSDAKKMASYKDAFGRPLPVDQFERWKRSVHANAMFVKGDLTAPTCNTCHGNHGATPPGVESVSLICGQCHAREADLFAKTAKHDGFIKHNDFLATGATCKDCHENIAPEVGASVRKFNECVTCHENHGVMRPTVALLGPLPTVPCAFCHEGNGPLALSEPKGRRDHYVRVRDALLSAAKTQNLKGDALFDWMVDQAQVLSTHVVASDDGKKQLRPEFARLFDKFRIGKTHYSFVDPASGKNVTVAIRRCTNCHTDPSTTCGITAQKFVESMQQVTSASARAERVLLAARRGGVEVRTARSELDAAIDSEIELQTLIHTFSSGGQYAEKQKEAIVHASAALDAGNTSLAEIAFRRRGLGAALGIIVLVLAGLALKIRQMNP
jgi:cytochrome b6